MQQRAITIDLGPGAKYETLDDYLKVLNASHWVLDSFSYLPYSIASDPTRVTIVAHQEKKEE